MVYIHMIYMYKHMYLVVKSLYTGIILTAIYI